MSEREKTEVMEKKEIDFAELANRMRGVAALLKAFDEAAARRDSGSLNEYEWGFNLMAALVDDMVDELGSIA